MIPRYSLPEMSQIWSDQNRLETWKLVEALVVDAWVAEGVAPASAAEAAHAAAVPTPTEVSEREAVTNHDVAAFVDLLAGNCGEGGEWIHYGLTSSDVLDTANGVLMRDAADLLLSRLETLFETVRTRALEFQTTPMVGRTHGIWAEPSSFGLKLATWAFEIERNHARMLAARKAVAVGKISGAVGTYAHTPPTVERFVCEALHITPEDGSTQVTHRDRHAQFVTAMALVGSSIERFATEIRHLQRSEVGEAHEAFRPGQKGSSAMPHKRNPILSERMTGMARVLRGYSQTALENVALWHERDISHSSAERIILPDACLLLDYMLAKFDGLIEGLVVDADRMTTNLESTRGLVFSQAVLLALVDTGMTRDDAYRIVQRNAMAAWEGETHLRDLLVGDPDVGLSDAALVRCFDPASFLTNTDHVFEKLSRLTLAS